MRPWVTGRRDEVGTGKVGNIGVLRINEILRKFVNRGHLYDIMQKIFQFSIVIKRFLLLNDEASIMSVII